MCSVWFEIGVYVLSGGIGVDGLEEGHAAYSVVVELVPVADGEGVLADLKGGLRDEEEFPVRYQADREGVGNDCVDGITDTVHGEDRGEPCQFKADLGQSFVVVTLLGEGEVEDVGDGCWFDVGITVDGSGLRKGEIGIGIEGNILHPEGDIINEFP